MDIPSSVVRESVRDIVDKQTQSVAAQKGRERIMNWVEQLGASPEDVMD